MSKAITVTCDVTFWDSQSAPAWKPNTRYSQGSVVSRGGCVYEAVVAASEHYEPGDRYRVWMPICYGAMPYRRSIQYREGACVYSSSTGDVWYLLDTGKWSHCVTVPDEYLDLLRAQIMDRSTTWEDARD